jgi:dihydrofolate reductase
MANLVYSVIASLDGYVNDERGEFGWAAPDEELHAFFNDLERPIGMYLYGRRMYETMRYWQTHDPATPGPTGDYTRIWQAADKVVYSRTLEEVSTDRTSLQREFDPDRVRLMKAEAVSDISIGGPGLAAAALAAGLVDECHIVLVPVSVGGGTPALPRSQRIDLELVSERRFAGGAMHLHYRVR